MFQKNFNQLPVNGLNRPHPTTKPPGPASRLRENGRTAPRLRENGRTAPRARASNKLKQQSDDRIDQRRRKNPLRRLIPPGIDINSK